MKESYFYENSKLIFPARVSSFSFIIYLLICKNKFKSEPLTCHLDMKGNEVCHLLSKWKGFELESNIL